MRLELTRFRPLRQPTADLLCVGIFEGDDAAGLARLPRRAPATCAPATRSSTLLHPGSPRARARRRPRQARRASSPSAPASPPPSRSARPGGCGRESIAWAVPEPSARRASRPALTAGHDPRRLPLRPLQGRATTDEPDTAIGTLDPARRRRPAAGRGDRRSRGRRGGRTGRATCRTCPRTSPTPPTSPAGPSEIAAAHESIEVEVLGPRRARARGHGRPARRRRRAPPRSRR